MSLRLYKIEPKDDYTQVGGINIVANPDQNDTQALIYDPSKNAMSWVDVATVAGLKGATGPTGPAQPVVSFCVRGKYTGGGSYVMSDPIEDWKTEETRDGLLMPSAYHEYTDIPLVNKLVDPIDLLFIAPVDGFYSLSITYGKLPPRNVEGRIVLDIEIIEIEDVNTKYYTEIINFDSSETSIASINLGSWNQTLRLKTGTTVRPNVKLNYLYNAPEYITFSGHLIGKLPTVF